MAQAQYTGTGRRKNAVARVRLVPLLVKSLLTKRCRRIHPQTFVSLSTNLCSYFN